jgi:hypothetical protein
MDESQSVRGVTLSPNNPFRPPDWRWQRARQLLEPRVRRRRLDEDWVVRARCFGRALARAGGDLSRPRLARAHPEVIAACRLWLGEPRRRWEVEARLLAGQDDATIADRLGINPGVIEAFEALFFDVRARLACSDWIAACVIGPRLYEALDVDDIETLWKTLAYHGGPLVLNALIDNVHTEGQPASNPKLVEQIKLLITLMTTPVTADNAMAILRLEARFRELDSAETARSVAVLNKPILISPLDVHLGEKTVPFVRAGCAPDDPDGAEQVLETESSELSDAG